jgi:hypothetical protein
MSKLTICARDRLINQVKTRKWYDLAEFDFGMAADAWLPQILWRFSNVKHLRFNALVPSRESAGNAVLDRGIWTSESLDYDLLYTGEDIACKFRRLFRHINEAGLDLESIATPLLGNRASEFSLLVSVDPGWAPHTLTRIALNVTHFHIGDWLTSMSNLEFVELVVSTPGHYTTGYLHRPDR